MPPRPEDAEAFAGQQPGQVAFRLVDLEPLAGLVAACTRLSVSLTTDLVESLPDQAQDALSAIQALLWRFEHAVPEPVDGG